MKRDTKRLLDSIRKTAYKIAKLDGQKSYLEKVLGAEVKRTYEDRYQSPVNIGVMDKGDIVLYTPVCFHAEVSMYLMDDEGVQFSACVYVTLRQNDLSDEQLKRLQKIRQYHKDFAYDDEKSTDDLRELYTDKRFELTSRQVENLPNLNFVSGGN